MNSFLTPEEAAKQLLVRPTTVKSWLREGKLKGFKAGKFWRIPTQELSCFLQDHQAIRVQESAPEGSLQLSTDEVRSID